MRKQPEVGTRFNRWTLLENKGSRALFRCDCGNEYELNKSNIVAGKSTQCRLCGFRAMSNTKTDGLSDEWKKRVVFQVISSGAKRDFLLSKEEVWDITQRDCFYCGAPPSNRRMSGQNEVRYNGIDRIDSAKDYYADNVRTACWKCNRAKHVMSDKDFADWITQTFTYMRETGYAG